MINFDKVEGEEAKRHWVWDRLDGMRLTLEAIVGLEVLPVEARVKAVEALLLVKECKEEVENSEDS